jgi:hypothetical protein
MYTVRRKLALHLVLFFPGFAGFGLLVSAQDSPFRPAKAVQAFDAPLKKEVVDNGGSQYSAPGSNRRNKLSCFFYSTFIVKQYDEGQKGSEWLAIAPVEDRTAPACTLTHTPNEKVITYPEWSGYFLGAKGRLVFFREADGMNAGIPFVVYDSQTKTKVFEEDSYHDTTLFGQKAESSPFNHIRVLEGKNGQFILKYLRVVEAGCDLHSEKSSCWERVRKKLKLQNTEMPTCTRYGGISSHSESAVAYPVEVSLFPKPVIKTIEGPVRCWPVD